MTKMLNILEAFSLLTQPYVLQVGRRNRGRKTPNFDGAV